ncbi:MAG: DASS family sodium-coupled anion symporter [Myxococcales bacterium]|nr:DASS family sodium-coupled anion symporter [Myxococcales bacterium]
MAAAKRSAVQTAGLVGGPLLALVTYACLPASYPGADAAPVAFSPAGQATAAVAVWMAAWWMTEAIPVFATALLPLALFPLFGAVPMRATAAPYGHELIFLFMGGFILALSMQRWGLGQRVALAALRVTGDAPERVVGSFMLVTAFLSMWVSNTATATMMLPIALSVIDRVLRRETGAGLERGKPFEAGAAGEGRAGHNFAVCLLLGVAYAASIGGVGTLIGTPPNLFLASFAREQLGQEISFVRWMGVGLPLVIVFLPLAWWLLTRFLYPIHLEQPVSGAEVARAAYRELGPIRRGEWATLSVFTLTASAWLLRPLLTQLSLGGVQPLAGLTDSGIAMIAALALFVIPVDWRRREFAMNWETAVRLPWGVLLLFGGGLSLAAAIQANGVDAFIGSHVGALGGLPSLVVVASVSTLMVLLTELTSNTAAAATLVPILAAVAPSLDLHPYLLIVPATLAASCAFMLPVATPPNAVVFGSGYLTITQMIRAGVWLIGLSVLLITALAYTLIGPVLGI